MILVIKLVVSYFTWNDPLCGRPREWNFFPFLWGLAGGAILPGGKFEELEKKLVWGWASRRGGHETLRKTGLRREYRMGWMETGGSARSRGFQLKERRRHGGHTDSSFSNFVFISGFWFNKPVPLLNPTKTRLLMDPLLRHHLPNILNLFPLSISSINIWQRYKTSRSFQLHPQNILGHQFS